VIIKKLYFGIFRGNGVMAIGRLVLEGTVDILEEEFVVFGFRNWEIYI
jgi:hypothetical protein